MDDLNIRRLYGTRTEKIGERQGVSLYRTRHGAGSGTVEQYELFPGISLYLMDLFVERLDYGGVPMKFSDDLLTLQHCEKGRFEGEFANGEIVFLGEGDLAVNMPEKAVVRNTFPLGRFRGSMILLELSRAREGLLTLADAFGEVPIDLSAVKERLLLGNQLVIYRNGSQLARGFGELYSSPAGHREFYLRLKVLSLLFSLSCCQGETAQPCRYFGKNQVQTVKRIQKFLTEHLDARHTLEELSRSFEIPLTSLKECFREVYGMPVNAYLREYRIQTAAALLSESSLSVAEIAERVGYANPSKFSEAFRRRMGTSPGTYRGSTFPSSRS